MSLGKKKMQMQGAAGGAENFAPVLYTGNSTNDQSITGVGFQPDFVWIKSRNTGTGTSYHGLWDSVRGTGGHLYSSLTNAETNTPNRLYSFDSDGFSLGNGSDPEYIGNNNYVAWCWKAGGTAVSNTDGIISSQVSANPDAGFSIVKYDGATNATTDTSNNGGSYWNVGHGLSSPPEMVIVKKTNNVGGWYVGALNGWTVGRHLVLNRTDAQVDRSGATEDVLWGNQNPTSTTFGLGGWDVVNRNGDSYIAYCFHSVDGYQKVGSYTGNNPNASTTRDINIGFTPRFVLLKNASTTGPGWNMYDSVRTNGFNIFANSSNAEADYSSLFEIITDGFRLKSVNTNTNYQTNTFIYLAIA